MRITFLIGNGFDINVGLATKYSEFYKYYVDKYPNDLLAKDIDENYEFWSDLEMGLGKYTANILPDKEEAFWESEELMENALADYLEEQMSKIQINTEEKEKEIAGEIQRSLIKFKEEFPKEQQQFLEQQLRTIRDAIVYSFISFNYTNALDTCVDLTKEIIKKDFGNHKADNGSMYSHVVGDVLHIHGTTKEELILGVNDVSQIANDTFNENVFYQQCLIKGEANKRLGQNKIQDARNIINSSMIICIFGMSIGETDRMWWEYLGKWLMGSSNRRLVIFGKNDKLSGRITRRSLFLSQNELLEKFRENTGLKNDEWNKIQGNIYIKYNSNLFDFKIVNN